MCYHVNTQIPLLMLFLLDNMFLYRKTIGGCDKLSRFPPGVFSHFLKKFTLFMKCRLLSESISPFFPTIFLQQGSLGKKFICWALLSRQEAGMPDACSPTVCPTDRPFSSAAHAPSVRGCLAVRGTTPCTSNRMKRLIFRIKATNLL